MDEDRDTMLALETQFFRWGRGAVGSAPRWHRGGRGFESHRLHQTPQNSFDVSWSFRRVFGFRPCQLMAL